MDDGTALFKGGGKANPAKSGLVYTGVSYLLGQSFDACFVLKFAPQRGEGDKRRECKFQNKAH